MRILELTVRPDEVQLNIGQILKSRLGMNKRQISRAKFTSGGIMYLAENSEWTQVRVTGKLPAGSLLRVQLEDEQEGKVLPVQGPLDILFENEDLLVINKPAGVSVHPGRGHYDDTIANFAAWYLLNKQGDAEEDPESEGDQTGVAVRTVGRLDQDTSGALIIAKSKEAAEKLTREGAVKKTYLALADASETNVPALETGKRFTIDRNICKKEGSLNEFETTEDAAVGLRAVTHVCPLKKYSSELGDYLLCRMKLETGRTHQIRVHMASIGHALLADPIYGKPWKGPQLSRAALHCESLVIDLPFPGEDGVRQIEVTSPLPEDMKELT